MKKPILNSILALSLALVSAVPGHANPEAAPRIITVTPDVLQELVMGQNVDILRGMNTVMRAKDQVAAARSELLPSISLNLVMVITNPPAFLLSSVSCLIPFMFPSRWFNLDAAKKTYSAEVTGLHLMRMNTYATAYALLLHVAGDEALLNLIREQQIRMEEYVSGLRVQNELGLIPQADLIRGEMELRQSRIDLSKTAELVEVERAALRKMMGLDVTQDFIYGLPQVNPSVFENPRYTLARNVEQALLRAPERRQLDLLLEAAKAGVKSAQWSFLAGCSGNQGAIGSNAAQNAFNLSTAISINLGFGLFPQVKIAKRNVRDVELRQVESRLEITRSIEATMASVRATKTRIISAHENSDLADRLLKEQQFLFETGRSTVKDILESMNSVTRSKAEELVSQITLAGHRLTLQRSGLEGQFLKVLIDSRNQLEIKK